MSEQALQSIAGVMAVKKYAPNSVIVKQEDDADGVYFVTSGTCDVIMQLVVKENDQVCVMYDVMMFSMSPNCCVSGLSMLVSTLGRWVSYLGALGRAA